jgi:C1A family cysteine protease
MPIDKFRLGWIPDLPDYRDQPFKTISLRTNLPLVVDLRPKCTPVYNQGDLGSCTANAVASIIEYEMIRSSLSRKFMPSRLFMYYNARLIQGWQDTDTGAFLRDVMKSVNQQGFCTEKNWVYDIGLFRQRPNSFCYEEAQSNLVIKYLRVEQSIDDLKSCLYEGFPFVFGFSVYDSFLSAEVQRTGNVPLPEHNESSKGGHAVTAVGYDDDKKCFIVRNSWGAGWGDKGYCYMPYEILCSPNYSNDFWTIRLIEEKVTPPTPINPPISVIIKARVNISALNVRDAPNKNSRRVGRLFHNGIVQIYKQEGLWSSINDANTNWVFSPYLTFL